MTTTKQWDLLNRLQSISSSSSASASFSFSYRYSDANQRVQANLADGAFWVYRYDKLGQVISGKKFWPDWTPVAGQQFEYAFDDIGNRTSTKAGGDEAGQGLRPASYSANSLNQYTNRDVPGYVDIMGLSLATSSVTLNAIAAYRHGEYFRKELPIDNTSASQWTNITVAATGQASVSGNLFVPKNQETFDYDPDGNMTNDGRWSFTWDAENRLTKVESLASGPTASKRKVVWEFDWRGRRIRQTTYDGSSGSYAATEDLKFLSDGWRNVAELNATNNALVRWYVWGLDLSGSLDGAGGIGGLLMMESATNGPHFYCHDGNGNVAGLVRTSDGTVSAAYEYDTFGRALRATGAEAKENPFRFSTKRANDTTDLPLYEMRPYSASSGRFLCGDPSGEAGGLNLYAFAQNDPVAEFDPLGLDAEALDAIFLKLDEARANISGQNLIPGDMAMSTGIPGLLARFGSLALQIKADFGDPGPDNNALWNDHRMLLRKTQAGIAGITPATIVHEMTHAYQDLVLHYWMIFTERRDEGEAYAVEGLYYAAKLLADDEGKYRRAGCNRSAVSSTWKSFWRHYGVFPGVWPTIKWSGNKAGVWMTSKDVRRVRDILGAGLNCRAIANAVNEILSGAGCNFMVECCPSDFPTEIGTGVTIDPVFQ
jgi:RHS repeat-associated protein